MKKREFLKTSAAIATTTLLPSSLLASISKTNTRLRTAHIGIGGMGAADLASTASHESVDVVAFCDVDSKAISKASEIYPKAKTYKDYRIMLKDMSVNIDAVIVSTPDHTLSLIHI